jgi:hypothetical protein
MLDLIVLRLLHAILVLGGLACLDPEAEAFDFETSIDSQRTRLGGFDGHRGRATDLLLDLDEGGGIQIVSVVLPADHDSDVLDNRVADVEDVDLDAPPGGVNDIVRAVAVILCLDSKVHPVVGCVGPLNGDPIVEEEGRVGVAFSPGIILVMSPVKEVLKVMAKGCEILGRSERSWLGHACWRRELRGQNLARSRNWRLKAAGLIWQCKKELRLVNVSASLGSLFVGVDRPRGSIC